jgi:hypothetical protein
MKTKRTQIPGVHFVRDKKREGLVRYVMIYDMDRTLTWETKIQDLERRTDAQFAARWGLSKTVFEMVRDGDVATRKLWFDIYYTPLMFPTVLGEEYDFSVEKMLAMQQDWLNTIDIREKRVEPFDDAVDTLLRIKFKWGFGDGAVEQWVHTDCPTPLAACKRLKSSGYQNKLIDGVIGMAPHCPDVLKHGKYAEVAGLVEGYALGEYANLPDSIRLVVELQQAAAKPSPAGVLAALETCHLHPDVRIIHVDDKWTKGGRVADAVRKVYPNTYFVLADCEGAEPVTGDAPPIFGRIKQFAELLPLVDKAFAEVAPPVNLLH